MDKNIDTECELKDKLDMLLETGLFDRITMIDLWCSFDTHRKVEHFCSFDDVKEVIRYTGRDWKFHSASTITGGTLIHRGKDTSV